MRSGKVIKPNHSPIITEEECEPSRGDIVGPEAVVAPITANTEEIVTSVTTNPRRTVTLVIANFRKVDTPITTDSTTITQSPMCPQRLTEPGMASHPKSNFLREFQNLHVRIRLLQDLKEVLIYAKTI